MKIWKYEIRKAKAAQEITSRPQITNTAPQGPMTAWFNDYVMRKVSGEFYEVLREGIPIIDSAIRRLISLNGTIKIIGDNPALVKELEDFCLNVPVNDTQKGIHAFLENASNEYFEQGFALAEFIATPDFKDIAGLQVADSKFITYRRNAAGKAEPWYRYPGNQPVNALSLPGTLIDRIINASYGQTLTIAGMQEEKLTPLNKLYFSINNENSNPYGVSMMRSMEFCAQILVTIENSFKHVFERFGDPAFHIHYKSNKTGGQENLETRKTALMTDWNTVIAAKRAGKSADLVTAGSQDSEVLIKVIGADNQIITSETPLRHVLEQIVSKTNLPAWMLGIYWSTTERMATLEVESALQDAKIRQLAMLPEFIRLFSIYLTLRGRKWKSITTSPDKPGDWGIMFETPNLRDVLAIANANFLNAQADMMRAGRQPGTQTNVTVGQATIEVAGHKFPMVTRYKGTEAQSSRGTELQRHKVDCGCKVPHIVGQKELSRPRPWPELDKVEADYQAALVYDWRELKDRVLRITTPSITTSQSPPKIGGEPKTKEEIPPIDTFTFTEAQRKAVMKAFEDYLGIYSLKDPDSPITWAYGQAYSEGLIRAATMIEELRSARKSAIPILDIIKNKEIFDELRRTGFKLIKDKATVEVNKAIDFMEEGMLRGLNPKQVAADLAKLFDNREYDWERLARSEMSMAAERAKLNEWDAWGVKMVEFTPAPDACPICFSVAGEYEIGKCPVPVDSTHPNCRCSVQPAQSEVDNG